MAREVSFSSGTVVGSAHLNAQQEVDSASAWGIRLIKLNSTTVRVPVADEGNGTTQSGMRIGGKPRYVTSPVDVAISGGAATFKVYLTAGAGPGFTGGFTSGAVPADSRKIGEVDWDGSAITAVRQMVDAVAGHGYAHRIGGEDPLPDEVQAALFMAGDLKATARSTAPTGWLMCDGSTVSRTGATAALFAAIGTTYGAGNGSTTFNLPDLRGRAPVGVDGAAARLTANDALGQAGGAEKHTLTGPELPTSALLLTGLHYVGPLPGGSPGSWVMSAATNTEVADGDDVPHNNMQPYQVVNWMVKT